MTGRAGKSKTSIFWTAEDEGGDEIDERRDERTPSVKTWRTMTMTTESRNLVATWDPSKGESLDGVGGKKMHSTHNIPAAAAAAKSST